MRVEPPEIIREARRILRLAWPAMLTGLNWTLLHLIDVAVVGHYGTAELGKLGASRILTYIVIVMGLSGMTGILVYTARADGAGDLRRTGDYLRQGIILGLLIGVPAAIVLLLLAEPLLRFAGVPAGIAEGAAAVVRMMAIGCPAQFVQVAASYFLEGVSRPRRVMTVNLCQLPANAVLAWALVGGHFGLPALGAVGAAAATAAVCVCGAAAMIGAAWTVDGARERGVRDLSAARWRRALREVPGLAAFGLVPAIAAGLELAGFSWLIALSTQLGPAAAAAFQTVFSLHNFAFAFGLAMASAAGVRVGNAVGAKTPDAIPPRALIAATLAMLSVGMIAVGFFVTAPATVALFSSDAAVRALAAPMLALLAPFMLFDGLQIVALYVLRSIGDQVVGGINGIVAFFVVTGGLGWLLVRHGLGAPGLIWAAGAGMVVAATLNGARMWWMCRPGAPVRAGRRSG